MSGTHDGLWAIHHPIERKGEVATIRIRPYQETIVEARSHPDFIEIHIAMALALEELRWDDTVRVIVITGERDGEFCASPTSDFYTGNTRRHNQGTRHGQGAMRGPYSLTQGVQRTFEALALMEKPVVAKLNGDALGFGQSVLWGCDLIVGREDAVVSDLHLSMGEVRDHRGVPHGPSFGLTPGDGAMAFLPTYMPATKLKEYLLLGRGLTAKELAEMHIVNYAVPADQLSETVDGLVEELLKRPPRTLVRAKRAANKHLVQQWLLTLDLSSAAEDLDLWENHETGYVPEMTFRPNDPPYSGKRPEGRS